MIELERVGARAGGFELRDVSVVVPGHAWAIVLGPAGAGKTTLLETIAGARPISAGRLRLRGVDATRVAAERRGVGIVYQHGYLFPHLGVRENVRYGARDVAWADSLTERFGAGALVEKPVRSLSGGERQVVALVRALAPRPDILLLDEPFAALDPRGRARVRRELHGLQRELGFTVMQVTHDFAEAGTVGDVALLMEGGRLVQAAPPDELFHRPATPAAAEFLGAENIYRGTVRTAGRGWPGGLDVLTFDGGAFTLSALGEMPGGAAHAVIRAEDVVLSSAHPTGSSARNALDGVVAEVELAGVVARVTVEVSGVPVVALVTAQAVRELGLVRGSRVTASIKATAVHLC